MLNATESALAKLAELRRLHDAASPAPWMCSFRGDGSGSVHPGTASDFDVDLTLIEDYGKPFAESCCMRGEVLHEDGALAAAARNSLPRLLDALEALIREREARHAFDADVCGNPGDMLEAAIAAQDAADAALAKLAGAS